MLCTRSRYCLWLAPVAWKELFICNSSSWTATPPKSQLSSRIYPDFGWLSKYKYLLLTVSLIEHCSILLQDQLCLGMPQKTNFAVFFNIVQNPLTYLTLRFEHLIAIFWTFFALTSCATNMDKIRHIFNNQQFLKSHYLSPRHVTSHHTDTPLIAVTEDVFMNPRVTHAENQLKQISLPR